MKITSVELIPFDQPYKGNLVFSANSVKAVGAFVLVRINTDEGYFGIGSSVGFSPSPNMNKGFSRKGCMVLLKDLSSLLIGERLADGTAKTGGCCPIWMVRSTT